VMALSADAFWSRPSGRAAEDAFAVLWSLASLTLSGTSKSKGRMLIETQAPDHHVVQAITRGDYNHFSRRELALREAADAPPFRTLVRLQIAGAVSGSLMADLSSLPATQVLGPSEGGALGAEILLKIKDFDDALPPLGTIVRSIEVRILAEVDPRQW
jgi:primosomal protein N'